MDLDVAAAAATNSGFVTNSKEILEGMQNSIMELLEKPLMPNDNG